MPFPAAPSGRTYSDEELQAIFAKEAATGEPAEPPRVLTDEELRTQFTQEAIALSNREELGPLEGAQRAAARTLLGAGSGAAGAGAWLSRNYNKLLTSLGVERNPVQAAWEAQNEQAMLDASRNLASAQQLPHVTAPSTSVSEGGFDPTNPRYVWERGLEAVGQMGTSLGAGAVLGPGAALGMMATQAGGSAYTASIDRLMARGFTEEEAKDVASFGAPVVGIIEYALEKHLGPMAEVFTKNPASRRLLIKLAGEVADKGAVKYARKALASPGGEALEEAFAEDAGMLIQRLVEQDPEAFKGGVGRTAEAVFLGAIGGGPAGVGLAVQQGRRDVKAEGLKRGREEKQQIAREDAEAWYSQKVQTPEGRQEIRDLAAKEGGPSRSDFVKSGFAGTLFLGKPERTRIAKESAERLAALEAQEAEAQEETRKQAEVEAAWEQKEQFEEAEQRRRNRQIGQPPAPTPAPTMEEKMALQEPQVESEAELSPTAPPAAPPVAGEAELSPEQESLIQRRLSLELEEGRSNEKRKLDEKIAKIPGGPAIYTARKVAGEEAQTRAKDIERVLQPAPAPAPGPAPALKTATDLSNRYYEILRPKYEVWSNVRDGSDEAEFQAAMDAPVKMVAQVAKSQKGTIDPALIDDALQGYKLFKDPAVRKEAAQLLSQYADRLRGVPTDAQQDRTAAQVDAGGGPRVETGPVPGPVAEGGEGVRGGGQVTGQVPTAQVTAQVTGEVTGEVQGPVPGQKGKFERLKKGAPAPAPVPPPPAPAAPAKPRVADVERIASTLKAIPAAKDWTVEAKENEVHFTTRGGKVGKVRLASQEELVEAVGRENMEESARAAGISLKEARVDAAQQGDTILLSDRYTPESMNHEVVHWMHEMGLISDKDVERFKDDARGPAYENIATDYERWAKEGRPTTSHGIFERMYDFIASIVSKGAAKRRVLRKIDRGGLEEGIQQSGAPKASARAVADTIQESGLTDDQLETADLKALARVEKEVGNIIEEAVKIAQEGGKVTSNEKKFFGEFLPAFVKEAHKRLGMRPIKGLSKDAQTQWDQANAAGAKKSPGKMGVGAAFDELVSKAGLKSAAKRMAIATKNFIEKYGREYLEYYSTQLAREYRALLARFPDLQDGTRFAFYRIMNGLASAQTDLEWNTHETVEAWNHFRKEGKIPVLFAEAKEGERAKPLYAWPHESDLPVASTEDVQKIVDAMKRMAEYEKTSPRPVRTPGETQQDYYVRLDKWVKKAGLQKGVTTSGAMMVTLYDRYNEVGEDQFRDEARTPFTIYGGSSIFNKAYNYKAVNTLLEHFQGDVGKLVDWFLEPVSAKELEESKVLAGMSGVVKDLNEIRDTVWVATDQDQKIPRTFIFGPKLGAYILNRVGDDSLTEKHGYRTGDFNTMDVWESRAWRVLFDGLYDKEYGIAGGVPRRVYMRAAKEFTNAYREITGEDVPVSAGQAARWYYFMDAMRRAGYSKVQEGKQTLASYTEAALEKHWRQHIAAGEDFGQAVQSFLKDVGEAEKEAAQPKSRKKVPPGQKSLFAEEKGKTPEEVRGDFWKNPPQAKARVTGPTGPGVPAEYVREGGNVVLYRYSKRDADQIDLTPKESVKDRAGFSRSEYNTSDFPRTFFYLNLKDREAPVVSGRNLYTASLPADKVYNLREDPKGLLKAAWKETRYDFDELFKSVQDAGYAGVHYSTGGMPIVSLLEPISAQRLEAGEPKVDVKDVVKRARKDGGFTLNTKTGEYPEEGFAVAPKKSSEYKVDLKRPDWEVTEELDAYVGRLAHELGQPDMHLGGWVNSDKQLVLDLSTVLQSEEAAAKLGRENDQDAIFDLKTKKEIPLKPKAQARVRAAEEVKAEEAPKLEEHLATLTRKKATSRVVSSLGTVADPEIREALFDAVTKDADDLGLKTWSKFEKYMQDNEPQVWADYGDLLKAAWDQVHDTLPTISELLKSKERPATGKDEIGGGVKEADLQAGEEQERRLGKSYGRGVAKTFDKIREAISDFWKKSTRAQMHLPNNEKFSTANEVLRLFKEARKNAEEDAARLVDAAMLPLEGPRQMRLFERVLLMENLLSSVRAGQPRRFGFESEEEIREYLERLTDAANATPQVKEALRRRRAIVTELAKKLVDLGLLKEEVLENDTYFHQQVLSYIDLAKLPGRGALRKGKKSYQMKRTVDPDEMTEEFDYNTSYVEAELQWITDAHHQIRTQELLEELLDEYEVTADLKRKARADNFENLVGGPDVVKRIEELKAQIADLNAQYEEADAGERRDLAAAMAPLREERAKLDPTYPFAIRIAKSMDELLEAVQGTEYEPDDLENPDLHWVSQAADSADPKVRYPALEILKAVSERTALIKKSLGRKYLTWKKLAEKDPELGVWQSEAGNLFYPVFTITERLASQLVSDALESAEITKEDIKVQLARGGKRGEVALPIELVNQLNEFKASQEGILGKTFSGLMGVWKRFMLFAPHRFLSYSLGNLTGDLDAFVGLAGPTATKKLNQARKEMWEYYYGGRASDNVKLARDLAVLGSGQTEQLLADFMKARHRQRLRTKKPGLIRQGWEGYTDFISKANNYREAVGRYALFLHYQEQLKAGEAKYAFAKRDVVRALHKGMGVDVAAAHLARNALGDYGNLSVSSNWMKRYAAPFWSWQAVNFSRYARSVANLVPDLIQGDMRGPEAGRKFAMWALTRAAWMSASMLLWNSFFFDDEEEELSEWERAQPHLNLGKWGGQNIVLRNVGALGDVLDWGGLGELPMLLRLYSDDQVDLRGVAEELGKTPIMRMASAARPDVKGLIEIVSGQSYFPDPFAPKKKDRLDLLASSLGVGAMWEQLVKPHIDPGFTGRGEGPMVAQMLRLGMSDPAKSAANAIMNAKERFLEKQGKDTGMSFPPSKYRNARYAAQNGDFDAFRAWRKNFLADKKYGDAYKGFLGHLSRLDPIDKVFNDADEKAFREFLTPAQRNQLEAVRVYQQGMRDTEWVWWQKASEQDDTPEQREELRKGLSKELEHDLFLIGWKPEAAARTPSGAKLGIRRPGGKPRPNPAKETRAEYVERYDKWKGQVLAAKESANERIEFLRSLSKK